MREQQCQRTARRSLEQQRERAKTPEQQQVCDALDERMLVPKDLCAASVLMQRLEHHDLLGETLQCPGRQSVMCGFRSQLLVTAALCSLGTVWIGDRFGRALRSLRSPRHRLGSSDAWVRK